MALPTLESLTATLDAQTVGLLGDTISYTPAGGSAASIKAFVDHTDRTQPFAGTQVTDQDISVSVRKVDVPVVAYMDVIYLPMLSDSFNPREWRNSIDGRHWEIFVKRVR